jgi:hypothetical protein
VKGARPERNQLLKKGLRKYYFIFCKEAIFFFDEFDALGPKK